MLAAVSAPGIMLFPQKIINPGSLVSRPGIPAPSHVVGTQVRRGPWLFCYISLHVECTRNVERRLASSVAAVSRGKAGLSVSLPGNVLFFLCCTLQMWFVDIMDFLSSHAAAILPPIRHPHHVASRIPVADVSQHFRFSFEKPNPSRILQNYG